MASAALAWPAGVAAQPGAAISLKASTCIAKQVSTKAICFSITIFAISARPETVGCQNCHQMNGIRRAMVSAESRLRPRGEWRVVICLKRP